MQRSHFARVAVLAFKLQVQLLEVVDMHSASVVPCRNQIKLFREPAGRDAAVVSVRDSSE